MAKDRKEFNEAWRDSCIDCLSYHSSCSSLNPIENITTHSSHSSLCRYAGGKEGVVIQSIAELQERVKGEMPWGLSRHFLNMRALYMRRWLNDNTLRLCPGDLIAVADEDLVYQVHSQPRLGDAVFQLHLLTRITRWGSRRPRLNQGQEGRRLLAPLLQRLPQASPPPLSLPPPPVATTTTINHHHHH
jgi:hypothetical protein